MMQAEDKYCKCDDICPHCGKPIKKVRPIRITERFTTPDIDSIPEFTKYPKAIYQITE